MSGSTLKDGKRRGVKCNRVRLCLPALHQTSGANPDLLREIDLAPIRAAHFTGSCGGEDKERECETPDALLLVQLNEEGWHLLERHGGKMFAAGLFRQENSDRLDRKSTRLNSSH